MEIFAGRPDLMLLFLTQIAFIIVQILIYLRISRDEKRSTHYAHEMKTEKSSAEKNKSKSTKTAKRKLSRR